MMFFQSANATHAPNIRRNRKNSSMSDNPVASSQKTPTAFRLTASPHADEMTFDEFIGSVKKGGQPPDGCLESLQALWHLRAGDWERAHEIAQSISGREGSWIHAHLHRVEGDLSNADYWYARSGRPRPNLSLEQEWEAMIRELLAARTTGGGA